MALLASIKWKCTKWLRILTYRANTSSYVNIHWYHLVHARSFFKARRFQWNQRGHSFCSRSVYYTQLLTAACDCDTRGTEGAATTCDIETGQCVCKENVGGQACDVCKVNVIFYKFNSKMFIYLLLATDSSWQWTELTRVIQEGFFNMRSEDSSGCEVCSCNSTGTETPDQCDPLTGACYCKSGFSGRNICHPVFYCLRSQWLGGTNELIC